MFAAELGSILLKGP